MSGRRLNGRVRDWPHVAVYRTPPLHFVRGSPYTLLMAANQYEHTAHSPKTRGFMTDDPALAALNDAEVSFYDAMRRLHRDGPEALLGCWADRGDASTMNAAGGYEIGHDA